MFGIHRLLPSDAAQLVIHPVIHVEYELPDRVWEAFDVTCRQLHRKIFNADDGVSVGAFAAKEFSERTCRHGGYPRLTAKYFSSRIRR